MLNHTIPQLLLNTSLKPLWRIEFVGFLLPSAINYTYGNSFSVFFFLFKLRLNYNLGSPIFVQRRFGSSTIATLCICFFIETLICIHMFLIDFKWYNEHEQYKSELFRLDSDRSKMTKNIMLSFAYGFRTVVRGFVRRFECLSRQRSCRNNTVSLFDGLRSIYFIFSDYFIMWILNEIAWLDASIYINQFIKIIDSHQKYINQWF